MKLQLFIILSLLAGVFYSCEVDNFDEPNTYLKGKIVYNGKPLSFQRSQVKLQLWEKGWDFYTPLTVYVNQTGSYSAKFHKGNYVLKIKDFEGPFIFEKDSINVDLNTDREIDIEVLPYYTFENIAFANSSDSTIKVDFSLKKVITDQRAKDIEEVRLYISNTQFVDHNAKLADKGIKGSSITDLSNLSLTINIPKTKIHYKYLFLRVGVKIKDRNDRLFSDVGKVNI
jgi:hypothetical protein